jgi:hypothetical protein
MKVGWRYAEAHSPSNFTSVMEAGLRASLSPDTFAFCMATAGQAINDGLSPTSWIVLAATISVLLACLGRAGLQSTSVPAGKNLTVALVGVVTLLVSYSIFGFSPEHKPTLDTWLNRVNVGGSLGASLIVVACFGLWLDAFKGSRRLKAIIFATGVSLLSGFFIFVDWQLAKPWITSWKAQKALMSFLRAHASEIKSGDSIIIGGIGRYTSKATPVVDGDWDWENIVRTSLNNPNLKGTVVTERLSVQGEQLVDPPCGVYPFKNMLLFSPDKGAVLMRVTSREEFMEQAQRLGWTIAAESR